MFLSDDDADETPYLFKFRISDHPEAEAGWSFENLLDARTMAHYTLRQALLGQQEPCGCAEIFDGISGEWLGAILEVLDGGPTRTAYEAPGRPTKSAAVTLLSSSSVLRSCRILYTELCEPPVPPVRGAFLCLSALEK